jgi:hypothetical protein
MAQIAVGTLLTAPAGWLGHGFIVPNQVPLSL